MSTDKEIRYDRNPDGTYNLVFSSLDGCVGTGVFREVREAKTLGKLIFYIFHNGLVTDFDVDERKESERTDRLYGNVLFPSW